MKLLITVLVLVSISFGTTYYLDASAIGTNNGLTKKNAWTVIDSTITNASGGDTVLVYSGGYEPTMSYTGIGTSSNYLHYIAVEPGVYFEDLDGSSGSYTFYANDDAYVAFYGIHFRRSGSSKYIFGNINIIVRNSEFEAYSASSGYNCRVIFSSDAKFYNDIIVSREYVFHNSKTLIINNCTILVYGSPLFSSLSTGTLDMRNTLIDDIGNGNGDLIYNSSSFKSVYIRNTLFTNWDTTGVGYNVANMDSVSATNLYDITMPMPFIYSLPNGSPAINQGTRGQDIGSLNNSGVQIGTRP